MREYGRVYNSFWSSSTTGSMSDDAKLLAIYLMTCHHSTIAGAFRLPYGYVSDDLGWTSERVLQGFAELSAKGFCNRCETTKWVCISKHFEWNRPENPNQRKAAAKVLASIPDECAWKLDFMRAAAEFLGDDAPEIPNPSATVPKPFLNQEQEQEQEQDINFVAGGSPTTTVRQLGLPCPKERIAELYHQHLPMLPRIKLWTKARESALRSRWGEMLREKKWATVAEGLDWFANFFDHAAKSDFLTGRKRGSGEHSGWTADFDFFIKPKGFIGVIEGKYDNQEAAA